MDSVEQAVRRVITMMHESLGEELTIDDMARTAMYSKFHFSRAFRQVTGLSPARFLAALRLQEAKRLLVSTSWTVADISTRVGYMSVGTFSTRFKRSVGVPPLQYRRSGGVRHTDAGQRLGAEGPAQAVVRGHIIAPPAAWASAILVGLFPDRLPQGSPIRCTALAQPGPYELRGVPVGTWYLLIQGLAGAAEHGGEVGGERSSFVASRGPLVIRPDTGLRTIDAQLRPMTPLDPPVLLALPDRLTPPLVATG